MTIHCLPTVGPAPSQPYDPSCQHGYPCFSILAQPKDTPSCSSPPSPAITVLGGMEPHPPLLLSRAFFGGLPAVFGLLSWLFPSLPAPLSLLPPMHRSLGKELQGEAGVLPFWPFGGAEWCGLHKATLQTAGTQEHECCKDSRGALRSREDRGEELRPRGL